MPPDIADALGSKPIAVRTFEVQAAFAMTFNKLQGATMESLVVVMIGKPGGGPTQHKESRTRELRAPVAWAWPSAKIIAKTLKRP